MIKKLKLGMLLVALPAIMTFGNTMVCAAQTQAGGAKPEAAEEADPVTWTRFVTYKELYAISEADPEIKSQLAIAWPNFATPSTESAIEGLAIDAVVFVGKKLVGFIAEAFNAEAAKHGATFDAKAQGEFIDYSLKANRYAAIEIRRDKPIKGETAKNLFRAIILIRPIITESYTQSGVLVKQSNEYFAYQLLPLYWKESVPAAQKVWGKEKKLTATLDVTISGLWRNSESGPVQSDLISAKWLFEKYPLKKSIVDFSGDPAKDIDLGLGSVPGYGPKVSKIEFSKGPKPSSFFVIPNKPILLTASVSVTEIDADKKVKYLTMIGDLVGKQEDKVGELIKDGLEKDAKDTK